jgi:hypothetical protein
MTSAFGNGTAAATCAVAALAITGALTANTHNVDMNDAVCSAWHKLIF